MLFLKVGKGEYSKRQAELRASLGELKQRELQIITEGNKGSYPKRQKSRKKP